MQAVRSSSKPGSAKTSTQDALSQVFEYGSIYYASYVFSLPANMIRVFGIRVDSGIGMGAWIVVWFSLFNLGIHRA